MNNNNNNSTKKQWLSNTSRNQNTQNAVPRYRTPHDADALYNSMRSDTRALGGLSRADTKSWGLGLSSTSADINYLTRTQLTHLRRECRILSTNSPIAKRYLRYLENSVLGSMGITLKSQCLDSNGKLDSESALRLENEFWQWAYNSDHFSLSGDYTFDDFQRMVEICRARDGEVFIRVCKTGTYGIQLKILDACRVDITKQGVVKNGYISQGIEYDNYDRPVAYYIGSVLMGDMVSNIQRIPADEIIHYFDKTFPDQQRGLPDFTPVLKKISDLDAFMVSSIVRARVAASAMGIIKQGAAIQRYEGEPAPQDDKANEYQHSVSPGEILLLNPGDDFTQFNPASPVDNLDSFMFNTLSSVAAGLGVFYNTLAGHAKDVSYTSSRFGSQTERSSTEIHQKRIINKILNPIFKCWLSFALKNQLSDLVGADGYQAALKKYSECFWITKKWESVDPKTDANTAQTLVDLGVKSRREVIAEDGRDPDRVLEEVQREREKYQNKINTINTNSKETPNNNNNNGANENEEQDPESDPGNTITE